MITLLTVIDVCKAVAEALLLRLRKPLPDRIDALHRARAVASDVIPRLSFAIDQATKLWEKIAFGQDQLPPRMLYIHISATAREMTCIVSQSELDALALISSQATSRVESGIALINATAKDIVESECLFTDAAEPKELFSLDTWTRDIGEAIRLLRAAILELWAAA